MPRTPAIVACLLALLAAPASAQRAPDTLVIGYAAAVTTIDPHYHNLGPNNATGMHIFSRLVERQNCDGYQWALLISTHEQRHILQIRELKAHPEYPKH